MDLIAELMGGTLFIQMGIVISLMILLHFIMFKPYIKLHEERGKRLNPDDPFVKKMAEDAIQTEKSYDEKIRAARDLLLADTLRLREEAKRKEREIIAKAKSEAAENIKISKKKVEDQIEKARKSISQEAEKIARTLAANLLGRGV